MNICSGVTTTHVVGHAEFDAIVCMWKPSNQDTEMRPLQRKVLLS